MNKKTKVTITFMFSLVLSFFIVGYIKNIMFVETEWVEGVTIWDKFRVYYLSKLSADIIPYLIIATLSASVMGFINRDRR